jgi:hypothetical protein
VGRAWVQPAGLRRRAGRGAGGDAVVALGLPVDDHGPPLGFVRHRLAERRSHCAYCKDQGMKAGLAAGMAVAGKDPIVAGKGAVVDNACYKDPVVAGKDPVVADAAGKDPAVAGKGHLLASSHHAVFS